MSFRSRRASWTGSRLRELVVRLRRLHGINHIGGLRRCCLHTLDDLAEDARGCHVGWWIWWYERWVCIIRLVVQSKVAPALRQLGRVSLSPQSARSLASIQAPLSTHSPTQPHLPCSSTSAQRESNPSLSPNRRTLGSSLIKNIQNMQILMHVLPYSFPSCHAPCHV